MQGECDTGVSHWGTSNLDDDTQLQRIGQIHVCDKAINELVTQPIIGQIIAEHLGVKKVKIWGSQLYAKPKASSIGAHVGWHRDSQHVSFYRKGLLTLRIPLGESSQLSEGCDNIVNAHVSELDLAFPEPLAQEKFQPIALADLMAARANEPFTCC